MTKDEYTERRAKLLLAFTKLGATDAVKRWPTIRESKYGFIGQSPDSERWDEQIAEMTQNLRDMKDAR